MTVPGRKRPDRCGPQPTAGVGAFNVHRPHIMGGCGARTGIFLATRTARLVIPSSVPCATAAQPAPDFAAGRPCPMRYSAAKVALLGGPSSRSAIPALLTSTSSRPSSASSISGDAVIAATLSRSIGTKQASVSSASSVAALPGPAKDRERLAESVARLYSGGGFEAMPLLAPVMRMMRADVVDIARSFPQSRRAGHRCRPSGRRDRTGFSTQIRNMLHV